MARDVRRYLSARGTREPTLAPDGTLAYLADTTGTMQVWTLERPGEWPTQHTVYDERVSVVSWSPAGDALAFGKDAGADEHDQLFRLDLADGTIARLTDRPDAIHSWGGWSPGGERIAFSANRRDPASFDVYVMDAAGGDPSLVCEGDGRIAVAAWDSSGDRLALTTAHASADVDLCVVDVDSGDRRRVTSHERAARYGFPTFGPDGDALYCTSDVHGDTMELVRIDIETRAVDPVRITGDEGPAGSRDAPADWSVDGFALDSTTGRLAYTRNVDGYSTLLVGRLTGPTEIEAEPVEVPRGVVSDLTIGPDGERAAMTVSSTNLNYSVYVVDLTAVDADEGPTADRWTVPSSGGVSLERYHVPELVGYETFDGRTIPAFFSLPTDTADGERVPVIVDIHGGPHAQRRPSWRNRPIRQYFLDSGYALFEPNVRGSSGYGAEYAALDDVEKRMDSVRDVASGVEWLRDHPSVDPDRIVAYGRSYGGFMVLACITEYPELWAAAVDFVGIADWITFLENTGDYRRSHREAEYGSLETDRAFLESISPIHEADRIECPLFVQHGANDPRVPVGEAEQIAAAVEEQGVPVETCIFDDEGHHTTKLENRIEQFERIAAFLDEHV
ncbi:S9 family peptidase [Natrononativus amylolyticus]|uniref:S9 family peptidase n=1 Tax=Natrononativus amylolyticus TaxID=2963434 RepID=UPI0020CD6766|nr:S9 family peptidase [Natrononativus amylolyticus]